MAGTTEQQLMTLAALAATAGVPLPSGESVEAQTQRIWNGLTYQLADDSLATGGLWSPQWIAVTDDYANMAYIATTAAGDLAVSIRGTVFSNLVDVWEDFDVSTTVEFPPGDDSVGHVAKGSYDGWADLTSATFALPGVPYSGLTLSQAIDAIAPTGTVYVAGHSLGGALAGLVGTALYVANRAVEIYTFAAPTVGVEDFVTWYDKVFEATAFRTYNAYDAVPRAWCDLGAPLGWYPGGPQPTWREIVAIIGLSTLPDGNVYFQPTANVTELNSDFSTKLVTTSFMSEVEYQHHGNTYLGLLGAPPIAAWPSLLGVSPASGPAAGGEQVKIVGAGFTPDCVADFGTTPATSVTFVNDTTLVATVPALAPNTAYDVTVSNMIGSSGGVTFTTTD